MSIMELRIHVEDPEEFELLAHARDEGWRVVAPPALEVEDNDAVLVYTLDHDD